MVTIETERQASRDDEIVAAVHDALNRDPSALGAAVSCDVPTATIAATFQVEADSIDAAIETAKLAFGRALKTADVASTWRVAEASLGTSGGDAS